MRLETFIFVFKRIRNIRFVKSAKMRRQRQEHSRRVATGDLEMNET